MPDAQYLKEVCESLTTQHPKLKALSPKILTRLALRKKPGSPFWMAMKDFSFSFEDILAQFELLAEEWDAEWDEEELRRIQEEHGVTDADIRTSYGAHMAWETSL